MEAQNFFGFGNETLAPENEDIADVRQDVIRLDPGLDHNLGRGWSLDLGLPIQFSTTEQDPSTIIGVSQPYGTTDFFQAGLRAELAKDARDLPAWPTRGYFIRLKGTYYPEWLDVEEGAFGAFDGRAALVLPISHSVVVASQIGGRMAWGRYPYYEAAYVGGSHTIRAFARQRFAGDASLYGSVELRFSVAHLNFHVPGELGLLGLVDTGRVWLEGEDSRRWHTGYGGGIWVAPLLRDFTMTLTVATGSEGARVYFGFGLDSRLGHLGES
jgi:hemolysin activation/secretion protein